MPHFQPVQQRQQLQYAENRLHSSFITMPTRSQSEKIRLEHDAAKIFLRIYERRFHKRARDIIHNEPSKPDVTCHIDQATLDLEIAHLYGSADEAMLLLGRSIDEEITHKLNEQAFINSAHERLMSALNAILFSKAEKHYDSKHAWLVIRNTHPAWSADEIRRAACEITVPNSHPFEQIWIIGDFEGESDIVKIFPQPALRFCRTKT